jgi:DNA-directed RNA polymerase specialized sigma24 family protein
VGTTKEDLSMARTDDFNEFVDEDGLTKDVGIARGGRQELLYRLVTKNDWEHVHEVEGFSFIFDSLPKRMRLIVDLKMSELSDEDIAKMMQISVKTVKNVLTTSKKRFMRAIL